ncbi:hypothetical protein CI102_7044 [Trichoderma harzianum]|nr:hypothetical protein CI102_7044 [Trichoderma harzianum]
MSRSAVSSDAKSEGEWSGSSYRYPTDRAGASGGLYCAGPNERLAVVPALHAIPVALAVGTRAGQRQGACILDSGLWALSGSQSHLRGTERRQDRANTRTDGFEGGSGSSGDDGAIRRASFHQSVVVARVSGTAAHGQGFILLCLKPAPAGIHSLQTITQPCS